MGHGYFDIVYTLSLHEVVKLLKCNERTLLEAGQVPGLRLCRLAKSRVCQNAFPRDAANALDVDTTELVGVNRIMQITCQPWRVPAWGSGPGWRQASPRFR